MNAEQGKSNKMIDQFKSPQTRLMIAVVLLTVVFYLWQLYATPSISPQYPVTYTQFLEQLDASNIKSVSIQKLRVNGELIKKTDIKVAGSPKPVSVQFFQTFLPTFQGDDLLTRLSAKNVAITVEAPDEGSPFWNFILSVLPWVLILGFWFFIMRRAQQQVQGGAGGLFTFGQSKAKLYDVKRPKVTFADVAGLDNVKQELRESIEFLKDSSKYFEDRRQGPQGRALDRPSGHREDAPGPRNRGRGRRALLQHQRLGVHRDVRRRGRLPGPGYVQEGACVPPQHHLY